MASTDAASWFARKSTENEYSDTRYTRRNWLSPPPLFPPPISLVALAAAAVAAVEHSTVPKGANQLGP